MDDATQQQQVQEEVFKIPKPVPPPISVQAIARLNNNIPEEKKLLLTSSIVQQSQLQIEQDNSEENIRRQIYDDSLDPESNPDSKEDSLDDLLQMEDDQLISKAKQIVDSIDKKKLEAQQNQQERSQQQEQNIQPYTNKGGNPQISSNIIEEQIRDVKDFFWNYRIPSPLAAAAAASLRQNQARNLCPQTMQEQENTYTMQASATQPESIIRKQYLQQQQQQQQLEEQKVQQQQIPNTSSPYKNNSRQNNLPKQYQEQLPVEELLKNIDLKQIQSILEDNNQSLNKKFAATAVTNQQTQSAVLVDLLKTYEPVSPPGTPDRQAVLLQGNMSQSNHQNETLRDKNRVFTPSPVRDDEIIQLDDTTYIPYDPSLYQSPAGKKQSRLASIVSNKGGEYNSTHLASYNPLSISQREKQKNLNNRSSSNNPHDGNHRSHQPSHEKYRLQKHGQQRQVRIKYTKKRKHHQRQDETDDEELNEKIEIEIRRKKQAEILSKMEEFLGFRNTRLMHLALEEGDFANLEKKFQQVKSKIDELKRYYAASRAMDAVELAIFCFSNLADSIEILVSKIAERQNINKNSEKRHSDKKNKGDLQLEQGIFLFDDFIHNNGDSSPLLSESSLNQPFYLREGEVNKKGLKLRVKSVNRLNLTCFDADYKPVRLNLNIDLYKQAHKFNETEYIEIAGANEDKGECQLKIQIKNRLTEFWE